MVLRLTEVLTGNRKGKTTSELKYIIFVFFFVVAFVAVVACFFFALSRDLQLACFILIK